jgi:hypothetical protein
MNTKFALNQNDTKTLDAIKQEASDQYHHDFQSNKPFKHVVIDNFLDTEDAKTINVYLDSTPIPFRAYEKGITGGLHKREYKPDLNDAALAKMFYKFSCPAFLSFLEGVTGIDGLVPDPYFDGGGIHETLKSGGLGIHTDFLGHSRLNLTRVINLIVYITEDWNASWGGDLELYDDPNMVAVAKVETKFNRAVIFKTDENSWHGLPTPINPPEGISRRSIALYYFVNNGSQSPDRSTVYYPSAVGFTDKCRASYTFIKEAIRPWLRKKR